MRSFDTNASTIVFVSNLAIIVWLKENIIVLWEPISGISLFLSMPEGNKWQAWWS
jgi:hypothetical protein